MIALHALWNNPVARWVGGVIAFLVGISFAIMMIRRDAEHDMEVRNELDREREMNRINQRSRETEDTVNEIRSDNARRDNPLDGMSDASRRVIFRD